MPRLKDRLYEGIDVYTTIDPRLQDLAQTTVTKQIDSLQAQHVTDGALVSLDLRPGHYGWIRAMVGSAHYGGKAGQINMAVRPRQPGSSMKPFNYIYAFTHGNVSPGTLITDSPIILPDPDDTEHHGWYQPDNYDHQFHGTITLRQALDNSLNVPAVKLEYYISGADHVAQTAARFGMKSLYHDNPGLACSVCYAVTLGGLARGTRPLEETAAYGTFAAGGRTVPPRAIWKVVDRSQPSSDLLRVDCPRGIKPAAWVAKAPKQVVDPAHAYEMTDVLSDNNARCTPQVCEFGLISPLVLDRPSAAKTGTTNDWTDNWTVGYVPQLVTGVWTGNADRTPMVNVIGITGAAPIWHDFMEGAFKILHLPVEPFTPPPGIIRTAECAQAGSSYASVGSVDVVAGRPGIDALPLCQVPDRGSMPIPCSEYPPPLPVDFQCPYGYTTYYGPGTPAPNTVYAQGDTSTGTNTYPAPQPTSVVPTVPAATIPTQAP